ncbi:MAG: hypothetical protein FD174_887 [Geobacteraceae bacterium]|nr:MAG: hypothetical protein FD174_887 [Geobacteraceae bacterium]
MVVDEEGKPIQNIPVGVGFERNTGSGVTSVGIDGKTNSNGVFESRGKTTNYVYYRIDTDGYYSSSGKYKFEKEVAKKWQPWNPEIKVTLRKIEKPVPMYARRFDKVLPQKDKDIGCDLIANDWVEPYGKGTHSDIVFHLKKQYLSDDDYAADLLVKFAGKNDGHVKYNLDMYSGSEFKLPRYAPVDGYQKQFVRHVVKQLGKTIKDDRDDSVGYVFRVRSGVNNSYNAMYGKIQRDVEVRAMGEGTAGVAFTYYLNPDHTRNLEFDSKRNLFTDLGRAEQVDAMVHDTLRSPLSLSLQIERPGRYRKSSPFLNNKGA